MTIDRILGGAAVLFGGFLLLYAIPENVRMVEGAMPYPAMFPQIASWLFIGLGIVQFFFVKSEVEFPSFKRFASFFVAIGLTLIALLFVEQFGYLPVMIALLGSIIFLVRERRPLWMVVGVLGLPVGVWVLFEFILHRPLP